MDGIDPALLRYYIKNKITGEKFYTINELINSSSHPTWNNYEYCDLDNEKDFWLQQDWTIEPKESLMELYKQRALQIRESYDYLVLYFSGGSDSCTILRTFLDNNIFLDEIVTYTHNLYENDTDLIGKLDRGVVLLKEESKLSSKTKITIHNFTRHDVFNFAKTEKWTNLKENSFNGNFTYFSRRTIDRSDSFKRPNSIAHIHGYNKPKFSIYDNYWFHVYLNPYFSNPNFKQFCFFFISKDFPKLQIKQHWEVIKLFEKTKLLKELLLENKGQKYVSLSENTSKKFSDPLEKCIRYGYGIHYDSPNANVVKLFTYNYKELTECREETAEVIRTILLNKDYELYKLYRDSYVTELAKWQKNNIENLQNQQGIGKKIPFFFVPQPLPTYIKIKKINII